MQGMAWHGKETLFSIGYIASATAQARAWDLPMGKHKIMREREKKQAPGSSAFHPRFENPPSIAITDAVYRWSNALACEILPPASPRPSTGLLYDQPANCCCIV